MARCRCSDITSHENKIRTLTNAQYKLKNADYYIQNIDEKLESLCTFYGLAFLSAGMVKLCAETKAIDVDVKGFRGRISEKISARKSELQGELANMRSEDSQYHEEERRKAQEEAERQRQLAAMCYKGNK